MSRPSFRIHGPRGVIERAAVSTVARARTGVTADEVSVTEIMSRNVVCAMPDLPFSTLVEVMVRDRLGCVPVVNESEHPVGMVTKLDIVEHLVVPPRQTAPLVADVMMPLAITLDEGATVARAATLMASEDMHHVMIVSERRLVGIVSTMDVTRWLANENGGVR